MTMDTTSPARVQNAPATASGPSGAPSQVVTSTPAAAATVHAGAIRIDVTTTVLDVVVPVLDEAHTLEACVRRLHRRLCETFPYPFRITVADNGSADGTDVIARRLAREIPEVEMLHLDVRGRGRALRAAWSASDAAVLAYMDVDLSTDLDALWPLVAPLLSGHSDLTIGTRLHRSSQVVRGARRDVISRCYNLGLHAALGLRCSDAQCGFKAIRADVARELLPQVQDDGWFFDTELLVLAERCGLRVHEVPVDWRDDPDSRVDVVATARDDIRGVVRLRRTSRAGAVPIDAIRARIGRTAPATSSAGRVLRFAAVGGLTTVLHLGGFSLLHALGILGSQGANLLALLVATIVNTALNRRWTFGVRTSRGHWYHQVQGLGILALSWALTATALGALAMVWPQAPTLVQTVTLGAVTVLSTVAKFAVMRRWGAGAAAPPDPAA